MISLKKKLCSVFIVILLCLKHLFLNSVYLLKMNIRPSVTKQSNFSDTFNR